MNQAQYVLVKLYTSPVGPLLLGSINDALCLCDWRTTPHSRKIDIRLQRKLAATYLEGTSEVIENAQMQLEEYFAGKRKEFHIPLLFVGTDFQKQVWRQLLKIPYGEKISYAELARSIGKPTAVRAVANANGANPLSIVVPCHRVIGSNHTMTGYGGGLSTKKQLLDLESPLRIGL